MDIDTIEIYQEDDEVSKTQQIEELEAKIVELFACLDEANSQIRRLKFSNKFRAFLIKKYLKEVEQLKYRLLG